MSEFVEDLAKKALKHEAGSLRKRATRLEKAYREAHNAIPCMRAAGAMRAAADMLRTYLEQWEDEDA
jgi:hypothetical protein